MTQAVFQASRILIAATRARQHRIDISVPRDSPEMKRLAILIGFATAVVNNGHKHQDVTLDLEDYTLLHGHWPTKDRVVKPPVAGRPRINALG